MVRGESPVDISVGGPVGVGSPRSPYARVAVVALLEAEAGWLLVRLPPRLAPIYTGQEALAGGLWAPPGGRLEEGEGLEDALRREMWEELGVQVVTAGPCFAHLTYHKGERLLAVGMACRPAGGADLSGFRLDAEEAEEARWVGVPEWVELSRKRLTPWKGEDIMRATHLARQAWQAAIPGRDT
ncbi:MAG: NUDIX hydrolase [Gaiellales bacterium]|nr:NUDIX hydrolase [Gaiellales bacterium]